MSLFIWVHLPPQTRLQEERWRETNSRLRVPITDVKESLLVQAALLAGEPVHIPQGWPTLRFRACLASRGEKALPQGPGDGDRLELKAPQAECPPAAEHPR